MARKTLQGFGAAKGLACGKAHVIYPMRLDAERESVSPRKVPGEIRGFQRALRAAEAELVSLKKKIKGSFKREFSEFIDAHILMLGDPEFSENVIDLIKTQRLAAASALKMQRDLLIGLFETIEDPYLRSRKEDLDDIVSRVYAALKRGGKRAAPSSDKGDGSPIILVCETIMPSDLTQWRARGVVGMISAKGSQFSHTAILARSLGLPFIIKCEQAFDAIQESMRVLVDGHKGCATLNPTAQEMRQAASGKPKKPKPASAERREIATRDGTPIKLWINGESLAGPEALPHTEIAGIGLYRTEFFYQRQGHLPTEEEQLSAYKQVVLAMGGKPTTLRTLDFGADKLLAKHSPSNQEPNPALGLRGIRLSLADLRDFATQLRAMLRAASHGPVRVLLPMVSTMEEIAKTKALIESCKKELVAENVSHASDIELGAMVETPGAALISASLARELDFIAIGSNDLVQYTLAADRNNPAIAAYYSPLHPAVLQLIALTVENAQAQGKPVVLCGELASDPTYVPILLALGLVELSVHPQSLTEVIQCIQQTSRIAMRALKRRILAAASEAEIEAILSEI